MLLSHFNPLRIFYHPGYVPLFQTILKLHDFQCCEIEQNTGTTDGIRRIRSKLPFHKGMLQTEIFISLHSADRIPLEHHKRKQCKMACCFLKYTALPGTLNKEATQNSIDQHIMSFTSRAWNHGYAVGKPGNVISSRGENYDEKGLRSNISSLQQQNSSGVFQLAINGTCTEQDTQRQPD